MINLTLYSNQELSLQVFNNQYFYNERTNRDYLLALVAEEFIYTTEQLETLKKDLAEDALEIAEFGANND